MKNSLFFIFALAAISCGNNAKPISAKEYYFPYKTFAQEVTYTYQNTNSPYDTAYWKMEMNVVKSDTFLTTKIYDGTNRVYETLTEKATPMGMEMVSHITTEYNTKNEPITINCSVNKTAVYKWQIVEGQQFDWLIQYSSPLYPENIEVGKTRAFNGEMGAFPYNNKKYECLVFNDHFLMKIQGEKLTTQKYDMDSYYAKGLGLIEYKMKLPSGNIRDYKLKSIN